MIMKNKVTVLKSNRGWALIVKNIKNLAKCQAIVSGSGAKNTATAQA